MTRNTVLSSTILVLLSFLVLLPAAAGEPGPLAQAPAGPPGLDSSLHPPSPPVSGPDHSVSAWDQLLAEIGRDVVAPEPLEPEQPGSEVSASLDPFALSSADDVAAEALNLYERTGEAPVLGTPLHRVQPHGHQVPLVRCLPLHACDLVFEPGEELTGWALGDSERWLVEAMTSGSGAEAQAHLLLKPTDYELATNLIVLTSRRTYRLELESPSHEEVHERKEGESPAGYDLTLSWWYPDEWVQRRQASRAAVEKAAAAAEAQRRQARQLDHPLDPRELSFDYAFDAPWRRSRRLGWRPVTIFDDGRQVYLRLPEEARRGELPVLLGRLDDGGHYPLNTRVEEDWMIVPVLFDRAELVLGTGDRRRSLTILAGREDG